MKIEVRVNGEGMKVDEGVSIAELLVRIGVGDRNLAVEHNHEFLEPERFAATTLREGDRLEIVRFVGGG